MELPVLANRRSSIRHFIACLKTCVIGYLTSKWGGSRYVLFITISPLASRLGLIFFVR